MTHMHGPWLKIRGGDLRIAAPLGPHTVNQVKGDSSCCIVIWLKAEKWTLQAAKLIFMSGDVVSLTSE